MSVTHHHLAVSRTARYATLGPIGAETKEVWFVCHGYGQLVAEFLNHFTILDNGARLLVAPEGLSRFYLNGTNGVIGASWMTREDRDAEIEDYVRYLDELYAHVFERIDRDAVRVSVLGFSQGVATATRWIARGRAVHADRLVLWSSPVPPEFMSREGFRHLRALELILVYGRQDEMLTPEMLAEQRAHLKAHGVEAREWTFDGGHRIDQRTLASLAES